MQKWKTIADIRREYGAMELNEENALEDPIAQFEHWFKQVLEVESSDPTAMLLSTVDDKGWPDSRVVLLKAIEQGCFVFYTNYHSAKAMQLNDNPLCALNFYWPQMARQVRIRGKVRKVSAEESDNYFASRPEQSQLSAIASPQSHVIDSRQELEQRFNELVEKHGSEPIVRPVTWGGYSVSPEEIEFWQGRNNRLHDRLHYYKQEGQWKIRRLAP